MTTYELEARIEDFQRVIESRDAEAAQGILDADYALCLVHPAAVMVSRAEWLAMLPDYVVHEWTIRAQRIDVDGDCAAVLQQGFQRATVLGVQRDGVFVVSDVWLRRSGVWKIWRRHSTPLSAGEMPQR